MVILAKLLLCEMSSSMTNKVRGAQTLENIYHWTQFVSDEKDIIICYTK